jgi:hypothetical protein
MRDQLLALTKALAELIEAAARVAPPSVSAGTIPLMRALHQRFVAEYEATGLHLPQCQDIAEALDRIDGIHNAGLHLSARAEFAFGEIRQALHAATAP